MKVMFHLQNSQRQSGFPLKRMEPPRASLLHFKKITTKLSYQSPLVVSGLLQILLVGIYVSRNHNISRTEATWVRKQSKRLLGSRSLASTAEVFLQFSCLVGETEEGVLSSAHGDCIGQSSQGMFRKSSRTQHNSLYSKCLRCSLLSCLSEVPLLSFWFLMKTCPMSSLLDTERVGRGERKGSKDTHQAINDCLTWGRATHFEKSIM